MSRTRPAVVRIYLDADILGLGKLLASIRSDCTFPGDPGQRIKRFERTACPIRSAAAKDHEWIPEVAARGWLAITRDRAIQGNISELTLVRDHGCKMVNLASADAGTKWNQLEVFMTRWREIEALMDEQGPFIVQASRTGRLDRIDLDAAISGLRKRRRNSAG